MLLSRPPAARSGLPPTVVFTNLIHLSPYLHPWTVNIGFGSRSNPTGRFSGNHTDLTVKSTSGTSPGKSNVNTGTVSPGTKIHPDRLMAHVFRLGEPGDPFSHQVKFKSDLGFRPWWHDQNHPVRLTRFKGSRQGNPA